MSAGWIDKDKGLQKYIRDMRDLNNMEFDIGFWGEERYPDDGPTVVENAITQEYGSSDGKIPSRPFMRHGVDGATKAFFDLMRVDFASRPLTGSATAVGLRGAKFIQEAIQLSIVEADRWATPLHPMTVAKKGHADPLIETGRLFDSVRIRARRR